MNFFKKKEESTLSLALANKGSTASSDGKKSYGSIQSQPDPRNPGIGSTSSKEVKSFVGFAKGYESK